MLPCNYTCCILGRAPCTKKTLLDFRLIMGPGKGDTMVWCWVSRYPRVFHGLTGCQRDPRDRGVTAWYQSLGKRYLRSSGLGIHKYGLDASSS